MRLLLVLTVPALLGVRAWAAGVDPAVTLVRVQFEAGAAWFQPWSSGTTFHAGSGYIKPFGAASYSCGTGYAEASRHPAPAGVAAWFAAHAIDQNPLFCVYRLKDGDLYVYDYLIGHVQLDAASDVRSDAVVNIVVGGSGIFSGASGVWTGTTDGRGVLTAVRPDYRLPASILKLMDGYLRHAAPAPH
ncbi:MAG: hypothetical protein IT480_16125 [Gammaproteobacteria bacterium]|nr:hypothetical protein [Gammaproteobacteria bacterium]